MAANRFADKTKADLVAIARISGLLKTTYSYKMSKAELAEFLELSERGEKEKALALVEKATGKALSTSENVKVRKGRRAANLNEDTSAPEDKTDPEGMIAPEDTTSRGRGSVPVTEIATEQGSDTVFQSEPLSGSESLSENSEADIYEQRGRGRTIQHKRQKSAAKNNRSAEIKSPVESHKDRAAAKAKAKEKALDEKKDIATADHGHTTARAEDETKPRRKSSSSESPRKAGRRAYQERENGRSDRREGNGKRTREFQARGEGRNGSDYGAARGQINDITTTQVKSRDLALSELEEYPADLAEEFSGSELNGRASADKNGSHHNSKTDFNEISGGILELMPDGYGFLRLDNFIQGPNDLYLPAQYIRKFNLRNGDYVCGPTRQQREQDRYPALYYVKEVNGRAPAEMIRRPHFDRLTPIYPDERFVLETERSELSTRIIDLVAPIGKGQRGMIVSPPKAGKTILLQKIANAITTNNPGVKLIVLLIDERPEEVTDMQRSINGAVVYSTFDKTPENHVKITELVLDHAERLVELGEDVVILLDSITRMGRAYNLTITPTGRTLSGGLDPGALYGPKRFFGAARNIEGGGSLTVIATALIDTGSRMDEVIFEEFKGTGNMEVYLDRKLSEKRIFPAIDINRSGTRREELLLNRKELDAVWAIRKAFGQLETSAVTETIIKLLLQTRSNEQFISSVNVSMGDKSLFDAMRGNLPAATQRASENS